ncbi:MAG: hypothetical protein HY290_20020 [Planctomycetia bacterium]|nr:hypothetical protein [Planctomycetia bacterium]
MPNFAQQLWNLAASVASFVADGCQTVGHAEYAARLRTCDSCPHRDATTCTQCGCFIPVKAQGRALQCPLGKWADLNPAARPAESRSPMVMAGPERAFPGSNDFDRISDDHEPLTVPTYSEFEDQLP